MNEIIIVILSTVIPTFLATLANIIISLIKIKNEKSLFKYEEQKIFNEQKIKAIREFIFNVQTQNILYSSGLDYNFLYCINEFLPYCPSDYSDKLKKLSIMPMNDDNFEQISNELNEVIKSLSESIPSLNPSNPDNLKGIKK